MSGQEVEPRRELSPAQALAATVRSRDFQEQVGLALPEGVPPSRFVRVAATALLADPAIAEADPDSVFNALLKAAADGLLPDGREAAIVLRKKKGSSKKHAGYLPMIGGYRKTAADYGWHLRTAVVHENDFFEYELGLTPRLEHRQAPLGQERGERIAAYCVATKRGEEALFDVMRAEEIEKARKSSSSPNDGPWKDWPERMWEKTVGRLTFKRLPLGERDQERVRRLLDFDGTPPAELAEQVYGRRRELPEAPAAASGTRGGDEGGVLAAAAPSEEEAARASQPAAASSPPFQGSEPEQAAEPGPGGYVLPEEFAESGPRGAAYAGKPLSAIVEGDDLDYLRWLASDAVSDDELRAAAAALLPDDD